MQNVSKFLNEKNVKKHWRVSTFLLFTQLIGCAPSSGGNGTSSAEALVCGASEIAYQSQNAADSNLQKIVVDPNIDNYIVEFEDDTLEESTSLPPSGNPIREYEVVGLRLKGINSKTFSFNLSGSEKTKKEMIERMANQRKIKFVEPDYPLYLIPQEEEDEIQASVSTAAQWHHQNVQTPLAWQVTTGSSDVVVAIVDSGIDYTHVDLKSNIWSNSQEIPNNGRDDDRNGYVDDIRGWNFVGNNSNPITTSKSNHGTHVAGIIGATGTGSRGIYGEARQVKLMGLKFIGDNGSGSTSNAIKAIDYAVQKQVFAINNSWGSTSRSQALESAIKRAERAGVLFVVAAGNGQSGKGYDISQKAYYPAAYPQSNVLRVAASRTDNTLTSFSNYSKKLVDVAAPGSSILSTVSGNSYMKMSGTSMAAPLVTGLAVLIKAANPSLNFSQVKAIISASVDPIVSLKNKISSGGRVNARKAVAMAANISADFSQCF